MMSSNSFGKYEKTPVSVNLARLMLSRMLATLKNHNLECPNHQHPTTRRTAYMFSFKIFFLEETPKMLSGHY